MVGAVESRKGTSRRDLRPGGAQIHFTGARVQGAEHECQDPPVGEGQLLGVGGQHKVVSYSQGD